MEIILWSYININTQTKSQLQIRDLARHHHNSVILLVLVYVMKEMESHSK